jgi:hypothetical protein
VRGKSVPGKTEKTEIASRLSDESDDCAENRILKAQLKGRLPERAPLGAQGGMIHLFERLNPGGDVVDTAEPVRALAA